MELDLSKFFEEDEIYYEFSGKIDGSDFNFLDTGAKVVEPIEYKGEIYLVSGDEMNINLEIACTYEVPCSRCLKPTIKSMNTRISGKLIEGREEDYTESDENDLEELIFFENNKLDLYHYIESQVYLAMPMQNLCDEDCKGLCVSCGINLNEEQCDCTNENIDPRLAGLKDFFR